MLNYKSRDCNAKHYRGESASHVIRELSNSVQPQNKLDISQHKRRCNISRLRESCVLCISYRIISNRTKQPSNHITTNLSQHLSNYIASLSWNGLLRSEETFSSEVFNGNEFFASQSNNKKPFVKSTYWYITNTMLIVPLCEYVENNLTLGFQVFKY